MLSAGTLSVAHMQLGSDYVYGWVGVGVTRTRGELGLSGGRRRRRERAREVNLSHQFETDLFFPAKVTSC